MEPGAIRICNEEVAVRDCQLAARIAPMRNQHCSRSSLLPFAFQLGKSEKERVGHQGAIKWPLRVDEAFLLAFLLSVQVAIFE